MTSLKIMLFNVQDLFIFLDNCDKGDKSQNLDISQLNEYEWQNLTTSLYGNKELAKVLDIARAIKDVDPDILMLVEVGGRESLENFNRHFLNHDYSIYHAPSNSDRGIDVGYLVKRTLPWQFRLKAFTNIKLSNLKKPARGFFRLEMRDESEIKLAIILTHLKSKLDLKNEDFEGRSQRQAEVNFLTNQLKKHSHKYPLIIAGDLNGIIYRDQTEPELIKFAKNNVFDVLELLDRPLTNRYTYVYFNRASKAFHMQLDYILLHESQRHKIINSGTGVYHFKTINGNAMGFPDNRLQKSYYPSDHLPITLEFML